MQTVQQYGVLQDSYSKLICFSEVKQRYPSADMLDHWSVKKAFDLYHLSF